MIIAYDPCWVHWLGNESEQATCDKCGTILKPNDWVLHFSAKNEVYCLSCGKNAGGEVKVAQ